MLESKIQAKIIKKIKQDGGDAFKISAASRRGVPDVLALIDGDMYLIEVKAEKGKLSEIQKVFIDNWNIKIYNCFYVNGYDDFVDIYASIKNKHLRITEDEKTTIIGRF